MIICVCRGKSDRDVRSAIEAGAQSVADLQACGIGTDCGACHADLRTLLARAAVPAPVLAPAPAEPAVVEAAA